MHAIIVCDFFSINLILKTEWLAITTTTIRTSEKKETVPTSKIHTALNKWEYNLRAAASEPPPTLQGAEAAVAAAAATLLLHSLNQLTPYENCVYCFIAIIEFWAWQLLIRMLIWIGWNQFCYFFHCRRVTITITIATKNKNENPLLRLLLRSVIWIGPYKKWIER